MPLDAVIFCGLRSELENQLLGLKLDKIQQPEKDYLLLTLRGAGSTKKLLISASSTGPRIHITELTYENPSTPPMFCMLLRKHLGGGRLKSISQPPMERVLDLTFDVYDEMGVMSEKHIVFEVLGRFSNIILLNSERLIIGCLRMVDYTASSARSVFPGIFYKFPPKQDKISLSDITSDEFDALLVKATKDTKLDKWLLENISGLSPLICREICHKAFSDTNIRFVELDESKILKFKCDFFSLVDDIKNNRLTPVLMFENGKPVDFSYIYIYQYGNLRNCEALESFSSLLESFYVQREKNERMRQKTQSLRKTVTTYRDRTLRKLSLQRQELKNTEKREELKRCGDLIISNIYSMHKGMQVLKTTDFFEENGVERVIQLDPQKTPQENAAKYYKEYNKAKKAVSYLSEQIINGENDLDYLDSVIIELDQAESEREINDIRLELIRTGYLREQKNCRKRNMSESKPFSFISSSGVEILVGRNNLQNDKLTMKIASKTDMWFHTQKIHGSHVVAVLNGASADNATIREAAEIAAYYSKARESNNVPVDYALIKHVKKPSGAWPGKVIYKDYKTIFVNPRVPDVRR